MSEKRVYTFGNGQAEGNASMREVLGGKGANLAEMNHIGVPVPPGFTITTDTCNVQKPTEGSSDRRTCSSSVPQCEQQQHSLQL